MSGHTKGPWLLHRDGEVYSDAAYRSICIVLLDDEGDDNARLISKSPELLSIVKRWAALDGGSWDIDRHVREKAELLEDTRVVIAEVEGIPS